MPGLLEAFKISAYESQDFPPAKDGLELSCGFKHLGRPFRPGIDITFARDLMTIATGQRRICVRENPENIWIT
jgi:hypothetical protein